jgi:Tol biopolymer transport system component
VFAALGLATAGAAAGSVGLDGRIVAVEGNSDAGLPCGDSAGHNDCGYDDSIVTFRSDGSRRTRLRRHVTSDANDRFAGPAWSPDGRRIAFLSGLRPATVRADGTHLRSLSPSCCFHSVGWARDGARLLLGGSSTSTENDGIYELRIKGSHLHRLTHGRDSDPTSSTTGAIAFARRAAGATSWIYVIRHPGGKPRRLLRGSDPDWSPDGEQLAFARADGIHTASASGRGLRRLTRGLSASADREPAWSPSGARIAFVRFPDIYIVGRDGGQAHEVHLSSDGNRFWESPSWQALK